MNVLCTDVQHGFTIRLTPNNKQAHTWPYHNVIVIGNILSPQLQMKLSFQFFIFW